MLQCQPKLPMRCWRLFLTLARALEFCRLPTSDIRKVEHNGLNKKSGNLNSALREIWPQNQQVDDRDILIVLDADQAAFPDFLTSILPCLDAGVESDNVALVQSPQVTFPHL